MEERVYDYLVLGAGPAGLQLGYELAKANRDYLILEGSKGVGHAFRVYPRHRKLLSINKVYTGYDDTEINLRWDWNSLLCDNDDLLFKNYSKRYLPDADDLVKLFEDFAEHYKLNIRLETRVIHITRDETSFVLTDTNGDRFRGKRLVVATGVEELNTPPVPGVEHAERYDTVSTDPDDFTDQRVLIVGKGNSAFEVADNLIETTRFIHVISPEPLALAWESRFVGNLRAVNNNFIDTYQLKCQNGVLDGIITKIDKLEDGTFEVSISYTHASGERETQIYDRVILATGFKFNNQIFDDPCRPRLAINDRLPQMTGEWESTSVPDMYFAGVLMSYRDYKKGTSSFIHGFRYNVRALAHHFDTRYHDEQWPHEALETQTDVLTDAVIARVNRTSALWQLFGYMCDLLVVDGENTKFFKEVPIALAQDPRFGDSKERIVLTLEFGKIDGNIFSIEREPEADAAEKSTFLHPILRRYKGDTLVDTLHLLEDLHADWTKPVHIDPLKKWFDEHLAEMKVPT